MRIALFGAIAFLSASCTTIETQTAENNAEKLAALMSGAFQTADDDPDNTIRDRRVRLTNAAFRGVWFYYQLNTGDEWNVYRQRVIELVTADNGDVIQKTYGLKEPEKFVDLWDNETLLANISAEDFEPYFDDGCEQRWSPNENGGWQGYVDPESCKIFSERRQANIMIEAEARLDSETYRQTERGFDAEGNQLFGTEPGEFIVLYRQ